MRLPRWFRRLLILLLLATTAAGATAVSRSRSNPPAPLRLPAEVRGRPGRLVTIQADTTAAQVRWHACRGPDMPDLWHSPDGKTLVLSTPAAGRYDLIAWTATGGLPSEAVGCTVVIESPEPPVPPQPPEPVDAFQTALKAAWVAETAADRGAQRDRLASLYRIAGQDTVRQPQLHTVGDLLAALQQAAKSVLPTDALSKVRAAIAAELRTALPTNPDTPLDTTTRDRCAEQFARVAKRLDALR
ncbi:MAG TPA: hypothetical protein VL371_20310 [Gemmataceae bacterium]|nr:hypothetical protein [Gemmataceae bacterium]